MRTSLATAILITRLCLTGATAQVSVPWTYTGGPLAGEVQCFVSTPDGDLYIGTDASGIYRSVDGLTWKRAASGLQEQNVKLMAVEPDGDLLALTYGQPYQGPHSPNLESATGYLYRSTNEGSAWMLIDTVEISALLVDSKGTIWRRRYTSEAGAWYMRSTNGGTHWEQKVPAYVGHPWVRNLAMDSSGVLYLALSDDTGAKATYRSTNSGTSWITLVANTMLSDLAITKEGYIFGIDPPNRLVRVKTDGTGYTVLDSSFTGRGFAFLSNGYVYAVDADGSLLRSTNNGASWTTAAAASVGAKHIYCPDGTTLYMTASTGRLLRASGRGWTDVSEDLRNTFVPSLLCTRSGILYAGTQMGIWRAGDGSSPWEQRTGATWHATFPPYHVLAMGEGSDGFLACVAEGLGYTDGGVSYESWWGSVATTTNDWTDAETARAGYSGGAPSAPPWQAKILPYGVTVGTGDTTYLAGLPMSTGRAFAKFVGGAYSALVGPLSGKTVYALVRNAQDTLFAGTGGYGVFRSATRGTTWAVASGGMADLNVYALACDPSGRLFAGTGTGVSYSTNNGTTWVPASGGPAGKVQSIATNAEGHVYVATTDYVWMSATRGSSPWYRLNAGLPIADITSLAIHPDGSIYAGTRGRGVYRRSAWPHAPTVPVLVFPSNLAIGVPQDPVCVWNKVVGAETYHLQVATSSTFASPVFDDSTLADTTGAVTLTGAGTYYWRVRAKNVAGASAFCVPWKFSAVLTATGSAPAIPDVYSLDQNFPNPFNPSTLIRYGLPERTRVRLVVYSALGQEVAVVRSGEMEAGYHEERFDARGLASGVYLCRLEAGAYVRIRKLMIIR